MPPAAGGDNPPRTPLMGKGCNGIALFVDNLADSRRGQPQGRLMETINASFETHRSFYTQKRPGTVSPGAFAA
jgi:hypothetical protein